MRVCHGICELKKIKRPVANIYDYSRRCTTCQVYYDIGVTRCPCCKNITRSKKRSNNRHTLDSKCDSQFMSQNNSRMILGGSSNLNQIQAEESVI